MFRTTDIVLIAVMISAAAFTYKTKHEADAQFDLIRTLEARIQAEEDTIDVLKADWSLLTQPSRLQRLVDVYEKQLQLQPVEAHQIGGMNELPARPLRIEDIVNDNLGGMADSGRDQTVTGGIVQ